MYAKKLYLKAVVKYNGKERSLIMKLSNLFVLNTIVALIFAVALLLAPKPILGLFGISVGSGVTANASMNFVTQLLGAALVVPALVSWFAREMTEASAQTAIARSLLVFEIIGLAISLLGMLSKVMATTGWGIVGLFLFFTVGYVYFLFLKQSQI
jgi:uncharacterized membrane protein